MTFHLGPVKLKTFLANGVTTVRFMPSHDTQNIG
jgi:hypothetical protein